MTELFDTTEFTVEKKENPIKEIEVPDQCLVIYMNTINNFRVESFTDYDKAVNFCNRKYPSSLLACRIVKSRDLFS